MEANPTFFRDLAYVFLAAVVGGLAAWRLRQPVIIGYVLAGILISPLTPGPSVGNIHTLELFAEIGVILLIFSIGLEFSLKDLLRAKWTALLGGPLGILLTIGLSLAVGRALGWTTAQAFVVGALICVASTMVLTRFLLDQGQLRTAAGRLMVAITLVEDLAVVILVMIIPSLANFELATLWTVLRELGRAAIILAPAMFIAAKVVPPFLKRVARTQSRELFFIVVLAICLSAAALTYALGLSLALGAFVAGLLISGSDYAHEALAQLFPVRDAFVALFFVTLGLLMDPRMLFSNLSVAGTLIALTLLGKLVVWTLVVRLFGHSIWTALTVAVGLTQIGEFSFLIVQVARNARIVGAEIYNATLAASLVTILINAAVIRYVPAWLARRRIARQGAEHPWKEPAQEGLANHVVLCGFGRVGSAIGTALTTFQVPYVVVEIDPDIVPSLRSRGIATIFGDVAHHHILDRAGIAAASLAVVTIPDVDRARLAVGNIRRANPAIPILARAHRRTDYEILSQQGATEVIQPELEASATLIRHAFAYLRIPDERVRTYLRRFREAVGLQTKASASRFSSPDLGDFTLMDSSLVGLSLHDARLKERFGITVIAIARASGEIILAPHPETLLRKGDTLRLLGASDQIQAFLDATATHP